MTIRDPVWDELFVFALVRSAAAGTAEGTVDVITTTGDAAYCTRAPTRWQRGAWS